MNTSKTGIDLIRHFEGFSEVAYLCPASHWTIGYGHISGVTADTAPITEAEGVEPLQQDLRRFERAVGRLVPIELNQQQFDALVCFSFNLGAGALQSSTLRRKVLRGDFEGAADEFPRWVYAGGRKLRGLVRRREAERALFLAL